MIETRQAKAVWRFYGPGSVIYHAAEAAGLKPEECVDLIEPLDEESQTKDGVLELPVHELKLVEAVLFGIRATEPGQWALRTGEISNDCWVCHMVTIMREVSRVLRPDGVVLLNVGDSHGSGKGTCHNPGGGSASLGQRPKQYGVHPTDRGSARSLRRSGLKPKDLCGMPWRLALALQADGWYLRSDIILVKLAPMPGSQQDRPTNAHEHLFVLSKRNRYWWDGEAIKEPCRSGPSDIRKMIEQKPRIGGKHKDLNDPMVPANESTNIGKKRGVGDPAGRTARDVWYIRPDPYRGYDYDFENCDFVRGGKPYRWSDDCPCHHRDGSLKQKHVGHLCTCKVARVSHFACFTRPMVARCLAAACPPRVCAVCGTGWRRVVVQVPTGEKTKAPDGWDIEPGAHRTIHRKGRGNKADAPEVDMTKSRTLGWRPGCKCQGGWTGPVPAEGEAALATRPGLVMDPFAGTGTTGEVAEALGREHLLIELSPAYVPLINKRLAQPGMASAFVTRALEVAAG